MKPVVRPRDDAPNLTSKEKVPAPPKEREHVFEFLDGAVEECLVVHDHGQCKVCRRCGEYVPWPWKKEGCKGTRKIT